MQTHTIKPKTKNRSSRRVGRGGKRGTYSGRGMKGQKSRSGARIRPEIRDLIKRIPKLRGDSASRAHRATTKTITLAQLGHAFKSGESVTARTLVRVKIISTVMSPVKIVSGGKAPSKLNIDGVSITASAKKAIESAGGSVA